MTRKSAALAVAAVVLTVLVATALHTRESGARAMEDSRAAEAKGDFFTAVLRARDAAECVPFSASDEGFADLEHIAKTAEARGDETTAMLAWRAMRAAALSSTSVAWSGAARREEAEGALARIGGRGAHAADARVTEASLGAQMAEERAPTAARDFALFLGAAMFLLGAARFAMEPRTKLARVGSAMAALLGAALCTIGLFL